LQILRLQIGEVRSAFSNLQSQDLQLLLITVA